MMRNPTTLRISHPLQILTFYSASMLSTSFESRKYFQVEEAQIARRIKSAIFLRPSFRQAIQDHPDIYGPFWIATTLIVIIIVTSSLHILFGTHEDEYDFHKLSVAAILIYGISFGCPYIIAIATKIFGGKVSVVELICIYGYSLTVFLPITFLCFINNSWVQVGLLAVGFIISSLFLIRGILSLDPTLGDRQKLVLGIFILAIQFLLVLMYKLYFFGLI